MVTNISSFDKQLSNLFYNPTYSHLKPSGYNQSFYSPSASFAEYIAYTEQMLTKARVDQQAAYFTDAVNYNKPFELRPRKPASIGVLCLPGLLDCPYSMYDIGTVLQNEGCLVRSILIPGTGTRTGDSLYISLQDFYNAVEFGLNSFRHEVDKVIIYGFSVGATLGLWAYLNKLQVDGLIMLSPYFYNANPINYSSFCYNWLMGHINNKYKFLNTSPYLHPAMYLSSSYKFLKFSVDLAKNVCNKLTQRPNNLPIYMAASTADETACTQYNLNYFQQNTHKGSRAIIYSNQNTNFQDYRITPRSVYNAEDSIIAMSHIGLPNHPNNPVFGKDNSYPVYTQYAYQLTKDILRKPFAHGDINPNTLNKYFIRRLTYNPDFDYLAHTLRQFITENFHA